MIVVWFKFVGLTDWFRMFYRIELLNRTIGNDLVVSR